MAELCKVAVGSVMICVNRGTSVSRGGRIIHLSQRCRHALSARACSVRSGFRCCSHIREWPVVNRSSHDNTLFYSE
eukprot:scaffold5189_cov275-Pinguiococcus_pyrenoidosus.AAC.5